MSKKSTAKSFKKKIVAGVIAFGLALASFTGLTLTRHSAYAYDASSGLVENYNFKDTSSSSTPPSPSSWSKITTNSSDNDIISGVFSAYKANSTEDESYLEKFKMLENPGIPAGEEPPINEASDTKGIYRSLLINSPKNQGRAGYQSNSFTLNADSYYEVRVTVMTITRDNPDENTSYSDWESKASIYLIDKSDDTEDVIDSFEMVDTKNNYTEYTMYIATNEFVSPTSALQLYLGGRNISDMAIGAVLFNSAQIVEIDRAQYLNLIKSGENDYTSITSLREETSFAPMTNSSFEENYTEGWTLTESDSTISTVACVNGNTFAGSHEANTTKLTDVNPRTNNSSSENSHILFMHLADKGDVSVKSQPITIKQHGFYRLSVWAYANGSKGTPSIVLHDEKEKVDDVSISISTSAPSNNNLSNNWVKYSFYIYGNAYNDNDVTLTLKLSSEEKGFVFFDDISMQEISGENYNSNKSKSNNSEFSLTKENTLYKFANYEFDSTINANNKIEYPLAPKSWTATLDSDYSIGGVINTAKSHFNANKTRYAIKGGAIAQNPGFVDPLVDNETSNNVLMIGNNSTNKAGFTNESAVTASANTTYKLSLYAHAISGGFGIKVYSDNYYIFNKTDLILNGWNLVEIYFTTGANSEDIKVELSQNKAGFAFVDKIKLEDSSLDAYASSTCANKYKVDLSSIDWENTLETTDTFAPLNMFDVNQSSSSAKSGIVDLSRGYYGITSPNTSSRFAMVVDSDSPCYYNVITERPYSLTSGSYYTIEALVRTLDVDGGAYFAINGDHIDSSFTKLNTKVDEVKNEWTLYTFYINAQQDTNANIILGLGDSETLSSGTLLVDHVKFTKLDVSDEEAFNNLVKDKANLDNVKVVTIKKADDANNDTKDESKDSKHNGDFNWAIVPSLITALAIFIALIGTLMRKVNWKAHAKVKTTYDRRKTLEKDMDRRERIALRQQIIAELNDQILAIDREIEEYKQAVAEQEKVTLNKIAEQQREYIEKKQAITAEKESLLRERNEKLAKDKHAYTEKAEADFNAYIKKLEIQEQKQQRIINSKEIALKELHAKRDAKLAQYLAKQAKLKEEIARVDAEIEEIARQEAQIWEEYKQAKLEAKRAKAEYKAQIKKEKEEKRISKKATKSNDKADKSNVEPEKTNTIVEENTTPTDNSADDNK